MTTTTDYESIARRGLELEITMPHGNAVALACREAGEEFEEIGEIVSTIANNIYANARSEEPMKAEAPLRADDDEGIRARLGSKAAKKVRARLKKGTLKGDETFHVLANRHGQHWYFDEA